LPIFYAGSKYAKLFAQASSKKKNFQSRKSLIINELRGPSPRKCLRANNLQHNAKKLHFFLYRVSTLWHIILMIKTVLLKNGKRVNLRKHQLDAIASINQEFYTQEKIGRLLFIVAGRAKA